MTKETRVKQRIINPTSAFLTPISNASQVGASSATAFNGRDNFRRPTMMELKRNESQPDRGYAPLVDEEVNIHLRPESSRTSPPILPSPHHRPSYLPKSVDYVHDHEDSDAVVKTVTATTVATTAAAERERRSRRVTIYIYIYI